MIVNDHVELADLMRAGSGRGGGGLLTTTDGACGGDGVTATGTGRLGGFGFSLTTVLSVVIVRSLMIGYLA